MLEKHCKKLQTAGSKVRLTYGDSGQVAYGTLIDVDPEGLILNDQFTGDNIIVPWSRVDAVTEINQAAAGFAGGR